MTGPGENENDQGAGDAPTVPPPPPAPAVAPGWYTDPSSPGSQRYWDGSSWTDHLAPASPAAGVGTGRKSGKATASLILGICGIIILPVVFSLLAIIFAVQARSEIERDPSIENKGAATAGLWLGIVGLAFWALILIAVGA